MKKFALRYQTFKRNKMLNINTVVDFKSDYNKTKISEMDISNIYLKRKF